MRTERREQMWGWLILLSIIAMIGLGTLAIVRVLWSTSDEPHARSLSQRVAIPVAIDERDALSSMTIKHVDYDVDDRLFAPIDRHTQELTTSWTEVRSMAAPLFAQHRVSLCANGGVGAIVRCNVGSVSFTEVIDCARDFYVHSGECVKFSYHDTRWHLNADVVARYDGVSAMSELLEQQSVSMVDLMPRDGDADVCAQCATWQLEARHGPLECMRAVVGDHPHARVLLVPCEGEPRWAPEHAPNVSAAGVSGRFIVDRNEPL